MANAILEKMVRLYEQNYTAALELMLEAENAQAVEGCAAFGNRLCAMWEMMETVTNGNVPDSVEVKQAFYEDMLAKLERRYAK